MKKFPGTFALLTLVIAAFSTVFINSPGVFAADNDSQVAGKPCALATSCLSLAQQKNAPIVLQQGVTVAAPFQISTNTPITIDLNGFTLDGTGDITLIVRKGTVTLTGKAGSTVKNSKIKSQYGTVYVKGSQNADAQNFTTFNIDPNVTISGTSPVVIDGFGPGDEVSCYGVTVNVSGHLLSDVAGGALAAALKTSPKLTNTTNAPLINILDGAVVESTADGGVGVYLPGYANLVAGRATISAHTGVFATTGNLEFNDTTVTATGEKDYKEQFGGKTGATGAAIQLESTPNGKLSVDINGGSYSSASNSALVEYSNGADQTSVEHIKITDGEFAAAADKPAIDITESFAEENPGFISGGTYLSGDEKSDIAEYMQSGLEQNPDGTVIDPVASAPGDDTNDVATESDSVNSDEANPNTADPIALYATIAIVALLGLGATTFFAKKVDF